MTIIQKEISFYSTIKFKAIIFFSAFLISFYALCFNLTSSTDDATDRLELERVFSTPSKSKNLLNSNSFDISFLKDVNSRWEELKTKLNKDHAGDMFLTKVEFQDFLNSNEALKKWQKHTYFYINPNGFLSMRLIYPVNEIPVLKYFPFIASRSCNLEMVVQPVLKNKVLGFSLVQISLPKWQSPLEVSNVFWEVNRGNDEWKDLKRITIREIGVFLSFEQKVESGR